MVWKKPIDERCSFVEIVCNTFEVLLYRIIYLTQQVAAFNAKVEAELHVDDESSIKWTDTSAEPPIIVGEPVSFSNTSVLFTCCYVHVFERQLPRG